jgi:hypothetical protein
MAVFSINWKSRQARLIFGKIIGDFELAANEFTDSSKHIVSIRLGLSVKQAYEDFRQGHLVGRAVLIPEASAARSVTSEFLCNRRP